MTIKFSDNLKMLRKQEGLTQADLAKVLGTTQRKVSYWEAGKIEPDLFSLWAISDYFKVSIDYLVGREVFD